MANSNTRSLQKVARKANTTKKVAAMRKVGMSRWQEMKPRERAEALRYA